MEGGYLMLIDMSGYVGEQIYVREMTSSLGQTGVIIIGDSATLLDPFFSARVLTWGQVKAGR